MPYLGNAPAEAYTSTVKNSFNGDGSTTDFTLSQPSTTNNLRVVVENVVQDPTVAYTVSGTTLTFTSAPPVGTANIYAVHLGPATQTAVPPSEINNATTYTSDLTVQGDLTVDTDTLYVDTTNNRVGVGTASPNADVHIKTTTPQLRIQIDPNSGYNTIESSGNNELVFGRSGTELARFLSTGGITFNGDTAAANALDDYEEGTWTPSFTAGVTGASYSSQQGGYTKIGNTVFVYFYLQGSWTTTGTRADVGGLPFAKIGAGGWATDGWFSGNALSISIQKGVAVMPTSTSYVYCSPVGNNTYAAVATSSTYYVEGSFSYMTTA